MKEDFLRKIPFVYLKCPFRANPFVQEMDIPLLHQIFRRCKTGSDNPLSDFWYFVDSNLAPSLLGRLTIEWISISQKTGRKCFLAFLFIKSSVSSHIAAIVKGMLPGNNHRGLNPLAHISASLMAITYRHSRCFLTACLSPSHTSNECQFFDKTIFSWQYVDKNLGNWRW